jgi:hypothetical protein
MSEMDTVVFASVFMSAPRPLSLKYKNNKLVCQCCLRRSSNSSLTLGNHKARQEKDRSNECHRKFDMTKGGTKQVLHRHERHMQRKNGFYVQRQEIKRVLSQCRSGQRGPMDERQRHMLFRRGETRDDEDGIRRELGIE